MTWIPIVVLLVIIGTDLWVYTDARKRTEGGTPVALSIGALEVNTPTVWFVACLILWDDSVLPGVHRHKKSELFSPSATG